MFSGLRVRGFPKTPQAASVLGGSLRLRDQPPTSERVLCKLDALKSVTALEFMSGAAGQRVCG